MRNSSYSPVINMTREIDSLICVWITYSYNHHIYMYTSTYSNNLPAPSNSNIPLSCKKVKQIIAFRRTLSRFTIYMILVCMGGRILSQMGGIQPGSLERLHVTRGVPGDSLDVSAGRDVFILSM